MLDAILRLRLGPVGLLLGGKTRRGQHSAAAVSCTRIRAPGIGGKEGGISLLGIVRLCEGESLRLHLVEFGDPDLGVGDILPIRMHACVGGVGRRRIDPGGLRPIHGVDFRRGRPGFAGGQQRQRRRREGEARDPAISARFQGSSRVCRHDFSPPDCFTLPGTI